MTDPAPRSSPHDTAMRLWSERYPSARVLFCAGSVVRGEGTPSSDLDVVVLFDHVQAGFRESLEFAGWPVEVFAHDPGTLGHFVAQDLKDGTPSLAHMLSEALVIPAQTATSDAIQAWARALLAGPPPPVTGQALAEERYFLTDLLHDFRDDRAPSELRAVACKLYPRVCSFVLKTRGQWQASGKLLPRLVARADPDLAARIERAFALFFQTSERAEVLQVAQEILAPFGGELFHGFRAEADGSWRVDPAQLPWSLA